MIKKLVQMSNCESQSLLVKSVIQLHRAVPFLLSVSIRELISGICRYIPEVLARYVCTLKIPYNCAIWNHYIKLDFSIHIVLRRFIFSLCQQKTYSIHMHVWVNRKKLSTILSSQKRKNLVYQKKRLFFHLNHWLFLS